MLTDTQKIHMAYEGSIILVVKSDNDCVFESRKIVMKKNRNKAID